MKIRVKSFEAWRFFMISTVFLAHCGFIMTNDRATEFFLSLYEQWCLWRDIFSFCYPDFV